ncbi:SDR family NAD(P)-dependent oxidoreductase [Pseudomonas sp. MWU13-2105]|uniref:SDR family NAD(P)-dependent oxidoreductase n=1 Tax=Pseudomonas sp. MWU13-2105 TaxID=2935074 RepID=UPI003999A6A3
MQHYQDTSFSESAQAVVDEIVEADGNARFWSTDVSDEEAISGAFRSVYEHFGRLDVLVNNAGIIGPSDPANRIQLSDWERIIRGNVTGPFLCTKHAIPYLRHSAAAASSAPDWRRAVAALLPWNTANRQNG